MGKDREDGFIISFPVGDGHRQFHLSPPSTGPDIDKIYENVNIPENYKDDYREKGEVLEEEVKGEYSSLSKLKDLAASGGKKLYNLGFRAVHGLYPKSDKTLLKLRYRKPTNGLLARDFLKTGENFSKVNQTDVSLQALEEYKPDNNAGIAIGAKEEVKNKKTAEILAEDFERLIDGQCYTTKALNTAMVSVSTDPDDIYEERDDMWKLNEKLDKGYAWKIKNIGRFVPKVTNKFLQWQETIDDKEMERFVKNLTNFGCILDHGEEFVQKLGDEEKKKTENLVENTVRLAQEDLDLEDCYYIKKALMGRGEKMHVITGMMYDFYKKPIYSRKNELSEDDSREAIIRVDDDYLRPVGV